MSEYTDGPADQPWEIDGTGFTFRYVQRRGFTQRSQDPHYERHYTVEDQDQAEHLAARLNDLDTARARIALLEARLAALCGAVERQASDHAYKAGLGVSEWEAMLYTTTLEALTAAREVLG